MTQSRDLFSDFEALSDEAWRAKVIKDLKGKDFEETLVWEDELGIKHQPYYRQSDLDSNQLAKPIQLAQKKNAFWAVFQSFDADTEDLKNKVENALANGVDEVQINAKDEQTDLEQLFGKDFVQNPKLRFRFDAFPDMSKAGVFYIDPIATYLRSGQKPAPFDSSLIEIFQSKSNSSADRFLLVDGSIYKSAGANVVEELALSLHHTVEYFDLLTENGYSADEIAQKITFKLAFGSSYFTEIAKGRAFRYLIQKLYAAYGIKQESFVWGESSWSGLAHKDPYTNLLRTTTQSMAAVLGNCDAVSALTFDQLKTPSTLGIRMAKNIQLILKEEAYMSQTSDMASGSYYVEHLSTEIAEMAWEKFLTIEEKGGLLKYFETGALQADLDESIQKRLSKFQSEKQKMVGVNSYENEAADVLEISALKSQSGKGLKKFLLAKEID
jgi:methylmalonyl-CoA mutase